MRIISNKIIKTDIDGVYGYICFFTGNNTVSGDSDLVYDPATDILQMKSLNLSGQAWITMPATKVPTGTTETIDWNEGNLATIDLGSASGDVTLTLSNGKAGASYVLKVIQGAVARNLIWPAEVLFEGGATPTVSTGNDDVDIFSFISDGVSFYTTFSQDLS